MRGHTIPPRHSLTFLIPSVIPDVFQSPSVIPDVVNREFIPMQGHTNEGTEKKDTGFPLKTGGNDRGDRLAGQKGAVGRTEGGRGQDRRGAVGRTEGGRGQDRRGAVGRTEGRP